MVSAGTLNSNSIPHGQECSFNNSVSYKNNYRIGFHLHQATLLLPGLWPSLRSLLSAEQSGADTGLSYTLEATTKTPLHDSFIALNETLHLS